MDELTESGDEQPPPIPPPPSNGDYYSNGGYDDPIMDDPVLSQFSHVLTLPRNSKRASVVSTSSQRNSFALSTNDIRQQSGRPVSMGPDQWRSSLRPRRNLASVSSLSLSFRSFFIIVLCVCVCVLSLFWPPLWAWTHATLCLFVCLFVGLWLIRIITFLHYPLIS